MGRAMGRAMGRTMVSATVAGAVMAAGALPEKPSVLVFFVDGASQQIAWAQWAQWAQ